MNRARAIHGDVCENAPLEEVNDVPRDPHLDHMRAHHEYASRPSITSFSCVPGNGFQMGMFEINRRVQGQDVVGVHIVDALGKRPKMQFRAVEDGIFRLHEGGRLCGK